MRFYGFLAVNLSFGQFPQPGQGFRPGCRRTVNKLPKTLNIFHRCMPLGLLCNTKTCSVALFDFRCYRKCSWLLIYLLKSNKSFEHKAKNSELWTDDTGELDWKASSHLWNQLPSFRQPHFVHSPPGSPHPAHITSSQSPPLLSPSITSSVFHSRLKIHLFTSPFLHSLLIPSGLTSRILNLYWTKWALAFACFSFVC